MKTITQLTLRRISVALFLSGLVGASAFAGPGPQFWARSRTVAASTPRTATTPNCGGCSATVALASSDRGPAAVSARSVSGAATAQGCTGCGDVATAATGATVASKVVAGRSCGAMACTR